MEQQDMQAMHTQLLGQQKLTKLITAQLDQTVQSLLELIDALSTYLESLFQHDNLHEILNLHAPGTLLSRTANPEVFEVTTALLQYENSTFRPILRLCHF